MIKDFVYNGRRLSDYGYTICKFGGSSGTETISFGNNLTFETVQNNGSHINKITSSDYGDAYSTTFQIIKDDCRGINDVKYITDIDYRKIMRWLNQKEYKKFIPISDNKYFTGLFFMGSFNISPIVFNGVIFGLELTFTSNAPYGFGTPIKIETNVQSFDIYSDSDEIGFVYPKIEITCLQAGNLSITNSLDASSTVINNCKANEVITLDSENQIIQSSVSHDKLYNDFNFVYPKIFSTENNDKNTITVSLKNKMITSYTPIRKVGVIL